MSRSSGFIAMAEVQRGIARLGGAVRGAEDRAAISRTEVGTVPMLYRDALSTLEALRRADAYLNNRQYVPLSPNPIFAQVKVLDEISDLTTRIEEILDTRPES